MLLLKNYNVIDTETGNITKSNIIVNNGLIEDILTEAPSSFDGEVIDGNDAYIMPGFINCHTHLAWDGITDLQIQSTYDNEAISAFKYADNMRKCLDVGLTTVRDLGMNYSNIHAYDARKRGIITSPRLYICGQAIMTTGGHTWWCGMEVDGPWEVRKAVRKQAKMGAKVIKIMASGSVPEFTMEELKAAVEESHALGLRVAAHATLEKAIENVVEAGVDSVEHGGTMSDELIEKIKAKGIYIIPTLSAVFIQAREGEAKGLPQAFVERRKRQLADKKNWDSLTRAGKAGVIIAYGNDAGSPLVPHDRIISELDAMLEIQMAKDNLHLLKILTANGADLIGDSKLGRIKKGNYADFVITQNNPIDDIHNIKNPKMVILEGKVVRGCI